MPTYRRRMMKSIGFRPGKEKSMEAISILIAIGAVLLGVGGFLKAVSTQSIAGLAIAALAAILFILALQLNVLARMQPNLQWLIQFLASTYGAAPATNQAEDKKESKKGRGRNQWR